MEHLSEREAVFARNDLFAAALAYAPGRTTMAEAEREVAALEGAGTLHAVSLPAAEDALATDRTVGEERETIELMRSGEGQGPTLRCGAGRYRRISTGGRSRPDRGTR